MCRLLSGCGNNIIRSFCVHYTVYRLYNRVRGIMFDTNGITNLFEQFLALGRGYVGMLHVDLP